MKLGPRDGGRGHRVGTEQQRIQSKSKEYRAEGIGRRIKSKRHRAGDIGHKIYTRVYRRGGYRAYYIQRAGDTEQRIKSKRKSVWDI